MERERRLLAWLVLAVLILYMWHAGVLRLSVVPGPEGVSCSLYSAVAYGTVSVAGEQVALVGGVGTHSVVGSAQPLSWIAYAERDEWGPLGDYLGTRVYGYRWVRPDPRTPVVEAVAVDRDGRVVEGINLQIRISRPTFEEVNRRGDPLGRDPTRIVWYSFETSRSEEGDRVTWRHYEVYVVPVDFVIELAVRPAVDLSVGDFQSFELWFAIDTVVWLNAFTYDQYVLLREKPPEGVQVTAYSFRGGFPIWAWIGEWSPWQVSGRDGNPDKFYDPSDLSPEEVAEIERHLQVMPSFKGSEVTLYTKPGYTYTPLYSADVVRDPNLLRDVLSKQIPGLPDPRFSTTVYFPLTLINYGAAKREGGWWVWYWHKEYYPVSYLRVRILYAIYGEWVFTWTKQRAEQYGYTWENRTSVITGDKSLWEKFTGSVFSFLTNPFTVLWASLVVGIVALVMLAIFAPGLLVAVAKAIGTRGEKR